MDSLLCGEAISRRQLLRALAVLAVGATAVVGAASVKSGTAPSAGQGPQITPTGR